MLTEYKQVPKRVFDRKLWVEKKERVCVRVQNNIVVEILWLMLNDLCAESLRDRLEFVFSPDVTHSG